MFLLCLYAFVALGVSFLCSIAEAVLLSVTPSYVSAREDEGSWSGRLLGHLKRDIDRPLSAILSLNTIAHTVGSVGVGAQASVVFGHNSVGIASAILTLLILVLSEIIPKTIGAVFWRQLALVFAVLIESWVYLLYPFVIFSLQITKLLSRGTSRGMFNREDLKAMVDLGHQEGKLEGTESRILTNLLHFRSRTVRDIMTPRPVVYRIQSNTKIKEIAEEYEDIPFSRIPLYDKDQDDVHSFVLKTDILLAHAREKGDCEVNERARSIEVIPENATLDGLFEFLLDHRLYIALVVDEYGGMSGIVTLEDLVETLIGLEIVDEADRTVDMQELAKQRRRKVAERLGLSDEFQGEEGVRQE